MINGARPFVGRCRARMRGGVGGTCGARKSSTRSPRGSGEPTSLSRSRKSWPGRSPGRATRLQPMQKPPAPPHRDLLRPRGIAVLRRADARVARSPPSPAVLWECPSR
ncbi:hypothetical protein QJS66_03120 [Kocuria rhizophila]|nr:hypothetical protein QJS66_03120 [Kocuria rhizophila]